MWGTTGLAQTGMFTMAQIWNIPGPQRPGYLQRLGRTGLFLLVLAVGVLATTGLSSLTAFGDQLGGIVVAADALALAVNMGMYVLGFRVLTPKGVPTRHLVPGAMLAGAAWTVLQAAAPWWSATSSNSGSVYGIFAIVLSLLAWIYLVVEVTVYAAEVNVVRVRRLWPRSIVQPPLTDADRAALALQPLQNQRREEQQIVVSPSPTGTEGAAAPDGDAKHRRLEHRSATRAHSAAPTESEGKLAAVTQPVRIVAALGGNALLERGEKPDAEVQERHVSEAVTALAPLARAARPDDHPRQRAAGRHARPGERSSTRRCPARTRSTCSVRRRRA